MVYFVFLIKVNIHLGWSKLSVMLFTEAGVPDSCWKLLAPCGTSWLPCPMLDIRNGGCVGWGMSWLSVSIFTITGIDGLSSADACAQSSPIWSNRDASTSRKLASNSGSTASYSLPVT